MPAAKALPIHATPADQATSGNSPAPPPPLALPGQCNGRARLPGNVALRFNHSHASAEAQACRGAAGLPTRA